MRGHDAWSCDLLPSDDRSNKHILDDVRNLLSDYWDLLVVLHLAVHKIVQQRRALAELTATRQDAAADVEGARRRLRAVLGLLDPPIPRVAVENPVMHKHAKARIATIRSSRSRCSPGSSATVENKRTCLWLRGLPALTPTLVVPGRAQRVHLMPPGPDRTRERSRFYTGIADAMADQWGSYARASRLNPDNERNSHMAWPNQRSRHFPSKPKVNRHVDGARASIGDGYVEEACGKLNLTAQRECNMYLEHFEAANILNWFFDEELLRQLRLIHGLIPIDEHMEGYALHENVRLFINYKHLNVPTILPVSFTPDFERCRPIMAAAQLAQEIHRKYARVRHVLRSFNRNATPGAVRAYWPAVLALCPKAPVLQDMMDKAPTRYDTPRDIGRMLPLVRETACTVAGMEMIPADATGRDRGAGGSCSTARAGRSSRARRTRPTSSSLTFD